MDPYRTIHYGSGFIKRLGTPMLVFLHLCQPQKDFAGWRRPGIIEIEYVWQDDESSIENVDSPWTNNVIVRCLSSLCVRNYCDIEFFLWPATSCTVHSYCRYSETDMRLLPWRRNLEVCSTKEHLHKPLKWIVVWTVTWPVNYHVLSFEHLCSLTTNRLSLCTECSTRCVIKCCF